MKYFQFKEESNGKRNKTVAIFRVDTTSIEIVFNQIF